MIALAISRHPVRGAAAGIMLASAPARERIQLAAVPSVSPDGSRIAFNWDGDIWTAATGGGRAKPLTRHPAEDHWPCFSPDGTEIEPPAIEVVERSLQPHVEALFPHSDSDQGFVRVEPDPFDL